MGSAHKLDADMPLREHAFQTAELCRLTYPDMDWMHLVGLLHGLGKLLAHKRWVLESAGWWVVEFRCL